MGKRDTIREELVALYNEGAKLAVAFQEKKEANFAYSYQQWYSKALRSVQFLAPERLDEFRAYYEINPKRKSLGYGTYVIQDYLKGVKPDAYHHPGFDTRDQALRGFVNQLSILNAVVDRIGSVLSDIEGELYAELQDSEIAVAQQLSKINVRAAGALVGVVIEGHLQKVALAHQVKIAKKNPTIADLNDPLKAANVIDTPTWRKISYLADLRNICSHKKDVEPTKEQVEELVQGAEWLSKNVF